MVARQAQQATQQHQQAGRPLVHPLHVAPVGGTGGAARLPGAPATGTPTGNLPTPGAVDAAAPPPSCNGAEPGAGQQRQRHAAEVEAATGAARTSAGSPSQAGPLATPAPARQGAQQAQQTARMGRLHIPNKYTAPEGSGPIGFQQRKWHAPEAEAARSIANASAGSSLQSAHPTIAWSSHVGGTHSTAGAADQNLSPNKRAGGLPRAPTGGLPRVAAPALPQQGAAVEAAVAAAAVAAAAAAAADGGPRPKKKQKQAGIAALEKP